MPATQVRGPDRGPLLYQYQYWWWGNYDDLGRLCFASGPMCAILLPQTDVVLVTSQSLKRWLISHAVNTPTYSFMHILSMKENFSIFQKHDFTGSLLRSTLFSSICAVHCTHKSFFCLKDEHVLAFQRAHFLFICQSSFRYKHREWDYDISYQFWEFS